MTSLLDPLKLGDLELPNRVLMAPLTRSRAGEGDVPVEINKTYYTQRAGAGLIVTEATNVSPNSCAFENAPGIYTDAQVEGWKPVTASVHDAGGRIFLQLWHCGRIGAKGIIQNRQMPMSPSGVNDDLDDLHVWGLMANGNYVKICATDSREMTEAEIKEAVQEYKRGAANAMKAGFDGVEVHAANGYLPHQFLSPTINRRTDRYGGPVENRARFLREILEALSEVMPLSKVGVRISPYAHYNNTRDPDPAETYGYVANMLNEFGVVYVHIADTNGWGGDPDMDKILEIVKPGYSGVLIGNAGMTPESAAQRVSSGDLDAIAFGRMFIANPDLPTRIQRSGPYNELRNVGHYGGDHEGYIDYPTL